MQFLLGLVAGLIIGWVIEWIIDWKYWRSDDEDVQSESPDRDADLRAELDRARLEIVALRNRLERAASASTPFDTLSTSSPGSDPSEPDSPQPAQASDRLEKIKGIGPVFARRLNEAGIYTFAELAGSTPDYVIAAVRAEEWQAVDAASWISAARDLATTMSGDS